MMFRLLPVMLLTTAYLISCPPIILTIIGVFFLISAIQIISAFVVENFRITMITGWSIIVLCMIWILIVIVLCKEIIPVLTFIGTVRPHLITLIIQPII